MWKIFGKKQSVPSLKQGRGFNISVVGTSHFQENLLKAVGGKKTEDGFNLDTTATLIPEPSNPIDKNAVAVFISGKQVGYLAKEQAGNCVSFFAKQDVSKANCTARIVGGWNRGDEEGHLGVKLSLSSTLKLAD